MTIRCYVKLESPDSCEYFQDIVRTNLKTTPNIEDAVHFDSLESATALIDYVLPKPLSGSWKVVQRGSV
jgi:hypothetical protein